MRSWWRVVRIFVDGTVKTVVYSARRGILRGLALWNLDYQDRPDTAAADTLPHCASVGLVRERLASRGGGQASYLTQGPLQPTGDDWQDARGEEKHADGCATTIGAQLRAVARPTATRRIWRTTVGAIWWHPATCRRSHDERRGV